MADEKVKLPRSSFEELCKIITAYGHQRDAVAPKDVAATAALGATAVSANNKFLVSIGVLEGASKKQVTSRGRKLAQALDLNMPEEIRNQWREVIRSCDFLSRIVAAVRIRKGMDESTLQTHIAYSAGEPNKGFVMTGARAVIDLLRAAELLREEDGKLTAVDIRTVEASSGDAESTNSDVAARSICLRSQSPAISYSPARVLVPGVTVNIAVNVECTPSELEGLGERLKSVIRGLSEADGTEESTTIDAEGDSECHDPSST